MFIAATSQSEQQLRRSEMSTDREWDLGHVSPLRSSTVFRPTSPRHSVPTGLRNISTTAIELSCFDQDSVSRMQAADGKGNQATPLASAICWKCCTARKLQQAATRSPQSFPQIVWKYEMRARLIRCWLRDLISARE